MLQKDLDGLWSELVRIRAPFAERRLPGRSATEVDAAFTARFGSPAPPSLRTWFTWQDGMAPPPSNVHPADYCLITTWEPNPLVDALRTEVIPPADHEARACLFSAAHHRWLVAEWEPADPEAEPRLLLLTDEEKHAADSLEDLIRFWTSALQQGLYYDHDEHHWTARGPDRDRLEEFVYSTGFPWP